MWIMILIGVLLAVLPNVSATWTSNLNNGLKAYYNCNDASDSLGINNGAFAGNAFTNATGKIGKGLQLDGAGDYIDIGIGNDTASKALFNGTRNFSVSVWINAKQYTTQIGYIGNTDTGPNDGWAIRINATKLDLIKYSVTAQPSNFPSSLNIDTWYHIVIVQGTSDVKYYKNGVNFANVSGTGAILASGESLWIGSTQAPDSQAFNGTIDEVGFWNRSLNSSEILALYNNGDGITYMQDYLITLISPSDSSILSTINITFNASFSTSGYNLTNATLWVWNSTSIFNNTETNLMTGTSNSTSWNISGFILENYKWNIYGCGENSTGSLCMFANSNFTFSWRPFEIKSQTSTYHVYETAYERFEINITTIPDILSVSSKLNYNGTLYDAVTSCANGDCNIYKYIDIPVVTSGENQNKSFSWEIKVFDGTNSYSFNTTESIQSQNVTRIHLEKCNATYTTKTLNFTAYQEKNLTSINPFYIAGTFNNWLGSGTTKRNQSFELLSTSNLSLCLSPIANTQYIDAQIEYSFENENITYIPRNYYFKNASLTGTTQEIYLYLLNAEDSTTFIIKVQDQKLSAVEDAYVYIQRYYPSDGKYRTVQISKTDSNGETIGFYEVETVDYKHIIMKNGVVLLETSPQKVVGKEVPFTLTFTTGETLISPWSYWEENSNIQTSLTYNDTNKIVTFSYIDITGKTTLGRLLVIKESQNNYTIITICNTSSTQSSATLTCNMTGYTGSFIAKGIIETEDNIVNLITFIITTAIEILGRTGLIMGWFIILTSGLAFLWNPTAGIVGVNASLWFVSIIGLATFSYIFLFAIMGVSIIAIILLKT